MKRQPTTRTVGDFLSDLERQNKTVAQWAREKNLRLDAVYAVVRGRMQGTRGQAREVLLAMNVPPPPMFPGHARRVATSQA